MEKKEDSLGLRALKTIEHASKVMMFGCKDCGDCSLPDIAYLCPKSSCSKTCRNGACGGSHDGQCEVPGKECIWARAYDRLKYYGETDTLMKGPAVFADASLQGTSAWANMFLARDHRRYVDLRVQEQDKTSSAATPAGAKEPEERQES
jgi:methylenetetrahydrofolate reductase (NADPH)